MTEIKIYIILGALAFIAFCSGALVFSAQHVVDKAGNLDVIHFTGIVVHSFAILTAVIFVIFRIIEKRTTKICFSYWKEVR